MPANETRVHVAQVGEMVMTELQVPERFRRREGIAITAESNRTPYGTGPQFAMALNFAEMIRAIREGGNARPSFSQAFHTHAAIEAAHKSAIERRWVTVREMCTP
jgi:predicted dehydrogenase